MKEILDQIVNINEFVIVDTCSRDQTSFLEKCGKCFSGNDFNTAAIRRERESLQKFDELLNNPSVVTIPAISKELSRHVTGLENLFVSIYGRIHLDPNIPPDTKKKSKSSKYYENKKLLLGLIDDAKKTYKSSMSSEVKIDDPRYKKIEEMVELVSYELDLKNLNGEKDPNKTDEKITATIFYVTMNTNIRPAFISRDKHFLSLLGTIPQVFGLQNFSPYNQKFNETLESRPFKFYKLSGFNGETSTYLLGPRDIEYQHFIPKYGNRLAKITPALSNLWKEYYQLPESVCV